MKLRSNLIRIAILFASVSMGIVTAKSSSAITIIPEDVTIEQMLSEYEGPLLIKPSTPSDKFEVEFLSTWVDGYENKDMLLKGTLSTISLSPLSNWQQDKSNSRTSITFIHRYVEDIHFSITAYKKSNFKLEPEQNSLLSYAASLKKIYQKRISFSHTKPDFAAGSEYLLDATTFVYDYTLTPKSKKEKPTRIISYMIDTPELWYEVSVGGNADFVEEQLVTLKNYFRSMSIKGDDIEE